MTTRAMASVIKLSLLFALAGCDAFSPPQSSTSSHRYSSSSRSTSAHRCSTALGMNGKNDERSGDDEALRRAGSSTDRRGFVGAVGAAALTTFAASFQLITPPALAVGKQPGSRTTAPPNALLLVPALRAKV